MAKVVAIGKQSFESIREKDNFYVDKHILLGNGGLAMIQ